MRNIKFRAWDKRNRQMIHKVDAIDWEEGESLKSGSDITFHAQGARVALDLCHVVLQQHIGRSDALDKEIYDGDILDDPMGNIYVVKFYNSGFIPCLIAATGDEYQTSWSLSESFRVIGNVFENPELLGST